MTNRLDASQREKLIKFLDADVELAIDILELIETEKMRDDVKKYLPIIVRVFRRLDGLLWLGGFLKKTLVGTLLIIITIAALNTQLREILWGWLGRE